MFAMLQSQRQPPAPSSVVGVISLCQPHRVGACLTMQLFFAAIYVYDAGEMCSEVLGTFAQSFNLAIAQLSKATASARRPLPRAPVSAANYRNIEKMRDEETAKYDVASGGSLWHI